MAKYKKLFIAIGIVFGVSVCAVGFLVWRSRQPKIIDPAPVFENKEWGIRLRYGPWFPDFREINKGEWVSCDQANFCIRLGFRPLDESKQYRAQVEKEQGQGDPTAAIIDILISGKKTQAYLHSVMSAEGVFLSEAVVVLGNGKAFDVSVSAPTVGVADESVVYDQVQLIREMILNNLERI